jgi:hypothetical protein
VSYGAVILDEQYLALRRLINEAAVAGRYIKTWSQDMKTKWPPLWQAVGEDPYIVLGSFVGMRAVGLGARYLFFDTELRVMEKTGQELYYVNENIYFTPPLRISRDYIRVLITSDITVGMSGGAYFYIPFRIKRGYVELSSGSGGTIMLEAPYGTIRLYSDRVRLSTGGLNFDVDGVLSAPYDLLVRAGRILMLRSDSSTIYLILGSNKYSIYVDRQGYVRALPVTG